MKDNTIWCEGDNIHTKAVVVATQISFHKHNSQAEGMTGFSAHCFNLPLY